ncbi:hypothetical protein H6P81_014999 [Aristolochia fimbriata]|uniref:MADS-box domain-containing protein n=1 Tax=Aristolochia fimbriata TaxID=158543 RepID=A0AAV7E4B8_ARIFI|nr:hypothetical protein H6P81_014999 [Aristolochia fimbriata]
MGRAKIPMKLIAGERNRRITFKKRASGLKKKMQEFTTLCDVKACMICLGPEGFGDATIWPEEPHKAEEIISEYRSRGAEDRGKRSSDLLDYLKEQRKKAEQELLRCQRDRSSSDLMCEKELDGCSEDLLRQIASYIDLKLESVRRRIEELKGKQVIVDNNETEQKDVVVFSGPGQHIHRPESDLSTNNSDLQVLALPISYTNPAQYPQHDYSALTILPNVDPLPDYDFDELSSFSSSNASSVLDQSLIMSMCESRSDSLFYTITDEYHINPAGSLYADAGAFWTEAMSSFPLPAQPNCSSSSHGGEGYEMLPLQPLQPAELILPKYSMGGGLEEPVNIPGFQLSENQYKIADLDWQPFSMAELLHHPVSSTFQSFGNQVGDFYWQY